VLAPLEMTAFAGAVRLKSILREGCARFRPAVWVKLIALLGVDAETGTLLLLYLDLARHNRRAEGRMRRAAICAMPCWPGRCAASDALGVVAVTYLVIGRILLGGDGWSY
jgi:hypothetical protein